MWPRRRKDAAPAIERKSASFLLGMGAGRYLASTATYDKLATEGYLLNCVAFACINRIATAIASVEPQLYQRGKGGKLKHVESHDLLDLLERPNAAQSGKEFLRHLASYHQVGGNAYVLGAGIDPMQRNGKPPTELQLLNPGKVRIQDNKRGMFPLFYEYRPSGEVRFEYPVEQVSGRSAVLHLKTFNPTDPWYGMSPLLAAAYGIDIHNGGQQWNKRLLDNDARPSGALTFKGPDGKGGTLSEEQYQRLKDMIDQQFSGATNAGRPLLLDGGLEWEALSLSAKDMDFLNAQKQAAVSIGLAFGVPPQLLGIAEAATFANYEQAMLAFWTDTVIPLLSLILEAFNRWLVPLYGPDLYLWYDEEMIPALEVRRKQKAERINAATYLTINERRRAMGYEDIEGGDTVLVQASTVPLELAGAELPEMGSEDDKPEEDEDEE